MRTPKSLPSWFSDAAAGIAAISIGLSFSIIFQAVSEVALIGGASGAFQCDLACPFSDAFSPYRFDPTETSSDTFDGLRFDPATISSVCLRGCPRQPPSGLTPPASASGFHLQRASGFHLRRAFEPLLVLPGRTFERFSL
jgi:hypothetical protein